MLAVSPASSFSIVLANEQATRRLAVDVASILEAGDLVTLSGDLGAGKTAFARALIRHLAGDEALDVPSPTFTLVQAYVLPRFTVVHADLYRVTHTGELAELGVDIEPVGREHVFGAVRPFEQHHGILGRFIDAELGEFARMRHAIEIG